MFNEKDRIMVDYLYAVLVNKNPHIREKYQKERAKGKKRIFAWVRLLLWNVTYYVFKQKTNELKHNTYYEVKQLYTNGSESTLSPKLEPEMLVNELMNYDIISFDVFDTLIFRPFSRPQDLFFMLGEKLNYLDFQRIRCEIEYLVRQKKYKNEKHHEVTLDEIYDALSTEIGIDKKLSMQMEIDLENQYCFANPYMMQVVKKLLQFNKKIIITSDMYLSATQIENLLMQCKYPRFDSYYVSSDQKKSKNIGTLYNFIKEKEGNELSYIHIGDNYISDIEQAKKQGFSTYYYPNVNEVGMKYRTDDMSTITKSFYQGLVNMHLHGDQNQYSYEYEYGYVYGGIFVLGYCQFIHQYVKENNIDKILFLARDGDIIQKAYNRLFPNEVTKTEYAYWSRSAAAKMGARYYKYDYFRRFLYHKKNRKYTLKQIFVSMEIDDMLKDFCITTKLSAQTELTDKNIEIVKAYLKKNWNKVLEHYIEQLNAGKIYYQKLLKNSQTAVAVDIGWAGSGGIILDHVVNEIWNMQCPITTIIAGTNTYHNVEKDMSESFLYSGKMIAYLYSQTQNRDLWKLHDPGKNHNLFWELLLSSPTESFKGFYLKDADVICEMKQKQVNKEDLNNKIQDIQNGIINYVHDYCSIQDNVMVNNTISGRDAYAPMILLMSKENEELQENLKELLDDADVI